MPLNPLLQTFFRSALPGQCSPINHHVILVPTTDVILHSRDRESNTSYADLAATEEFLASHVLRVPGGTALGSSAKDGSNIRENKSKAKQYSTVNGRTVVIKDSYVYSNKGFKNLNQAQILQDAIYYPNVADGQQWLIYYISKPLVGSFLATPVIPAVLEAKPEIEAQEATTNEVNALVLGRKKEIKTFGDLLYQYPMIFRQMQTGLDQVVKNFLTVHGQPLQERRSRPSSITSRKTNRSASSSRSSLASSTSGNGPVFATSLELEPEEEAMRSSLEHAVSAAIALFQGVDKRQLSLLSTHSELTGTAVERMIERYIVEQVHDQAPFPQICAVHKDEDSDLDAKLHKMRAVDVAQIGIPVENGMRGKRELVARLANGVEVFKKMTEARSPGAMLDILLATQKTISEQPTDSGSSDQSTLAVAVNADVLVSMLLAVVIRSGVRHLHSREVYMRCFAFTDDVETGEQGYALATFEAVLVHLAHGSSALRKASQRNRLLWQAAKTGDIHGLQAVLQPTVQPSGEDSIAEAPSGVNFSDEEADQSPDTVQPDQGGPEFAAVNGSLNHVFPFQRPPTPPPDCRRKSKKRVSLAVLPRSQSTSSVGSSRSHSRSKSIDSAVSNSTGAGAGGDLSAEKLAQTQDANGSSVLMMAVDGGHAKALKFLLSLPAKFRLEFVLDDVNNDGITLLSAAVQSGNRAVTSKLINYLQTNASEEQLQQYLRIQDNQGRCVAHYLFHQPCLIQLFGKKLPWRLKDKNGQTPLFALCRSYDHGEYQTMVETAMALAAEAQGDNEPLHLDEHVDAKGNTLLHIVHDTALVLRLLRESDADVNAANDRGFTPLMVGSKYGRTDVVQVLFGDPRVDVTLKDVRGLSAVDLAKDDDVRNRIDDLVLLSTPGNKDGRTTTIVRSFFVEDGTIRLVIKSGAPNEKGRITVSTCRRSVADFENLALWLSTECPASWLPSNFAFQSPFLIPSKPSRAVMRDIQMRLDRFLNQLLSHGTFSTHELVWEFFLVPELDPSMLTERTKRKAEVRIENLADDYDPVSLDETAEIQNFVAYAKDQVKGVVWATKKTIRTVNRLRMLNNDLFEAQELAASAIGDLQFLPSNYPVAVMRYGKTLMPSEASSNTTLYYALHALQTSSAALQYAFNRPTYLIGSMFAAQRTIERSLDSISRSNRWTPNVGLFEGTRRAVEAEATEKAAKARTELVSLGRELRYTQQTVASELAAWQEEHVRSGRAMLRRFASDSLVKERARLEGMKRALRVLRN
ncbi:ankyrin [Piedraia hortae CBS 480.64]|uniref:Ankyrin n=1 Tax=Piedraia hortae CBS 480.64 TaxID=1314780 RepID=A0A6A7BRJ7_9PEZI|nr:ankyrin [Piedraia hortae CBS 480.64]